MVLNCLNQLARPEPIRLRSPLPVAQTVMPDHIISLENGRSYKILKRHLKMHGMTPAEYRRKWGLSVDYPMIAPNHAAERATLAKKSGFGQYLRKR